MDLDFVKRMVTMLCVHVHCLDRIAIVCSSHMAAGARCIYKTSIFEILQVQQPRHKCKFQPLGSSCHCEPEPGIRRQQA